MTKTKFILAGLMAGAVAFGAGCKTDTAARGTTEQSVPAPDTGTGGTGFDTPQSMPQDGTMAPIEDDASVREREPGVHQTPPIIDEPGTGGSGLPDSDGLERPDGLGQDNLGQDDANTTIVPDANDAPVNDGMMNNGTSVPQ
ncbi:hypothetical protein [Archangium primigenium]|uniref:hypothetical protein n=1 Tax=[Archangium] primigenium TaxID=2792470 RepID=UPI00195BACF3|nr:hypothetical protein [Archangium primigenium]MBM7112731.1 hypothetical protein [Archangium primigenium]